MTGHGVWVERHSGTYKHAQARPCPPPIPWSVARHRTQPAREARSQPSQPTESLTGVLAKAQRRSNVVIDFAHLRISTSHPSQPASRRDRNVRICHESRNWWAGSSRLSHWVWPLLQDTPGYRTRYLWLPLALRLARATILYWDISPSWAKSLIESRLPSSRRYG